MAPLINTMADLFKALGDTTRLRIIRILASNEKSLCVADLAQMIGMTPSAISQHIKILKNIGILEPNRQGFHVYYTVNNDTISDYRLKVDELFKKAYIKCSKNIPCSECPENEECE
ncbi:MAG: winged helix-turn-helix transcriptional regulator [Deltaproteobacteria bacterium]|nr:winged helix-turn-helix transcriptional regulator [Deltaproteobacteria bacterium]